MKFHVQLFLERLALSIGATYHDTLKVIRTLNIVFSSNQDRSELPAFITFPYVYSIICSQMCTNLVTLVITQNFIIRYFEKYVFIGEKILQ